MYKKVVKYENFEGEKVEKNLYFNITQAELVRLEMNYPNGLQAYIHEVIESQDKKKIMDLFEMFITLSYGKRTESNDFIKLDEKEIAVFKASELYSSLFMELLTDEAAQQDFFMGIMPKELREAAAREIQKMEKADDKPTLPQS